MRHDERSSKTARIGSADTIIKKLERDSLTQHAYFGTTGYRSPGSYEQAAFPGDPLPLWPDDSCGRVPAIPGSINHWETHFALVWRDPSGLDHLLAVFSTVAARRLPVCPYPVSEALRTEPNDRPS